MRWSIAGRPAATAATINHVGAQMWNPSSTKTVWVTAIGYSKTVATADQMALKRSTARGTVPTSTITPTIASDYDRITSPVSAAVLELATFTTQPTLEGVPLLQYSLPAAVASGFIMPFESKDLHGIEILPGAGLCIYTPVATILQPADVTFFMFE